MDIVIELTSLKNNRLLRNEIEIEKFEESIKNVLEMKDPKHIEVLCQGFDDSTENDEVMFGLIHAIESYDTIVSSEVSLYILGESIPKMIPHAEEWLKVLHKRILNHERSRDDYKRIIPTLNSDAQEMVVSLLNDIKKKNPVQFEQKVNFVLYVYDCIKEVEDFLGGTFHQDMNSPEEAIEDFIENSSKECLRETINSCNEFLNSHLNTHEKERFIKENTELYFPEFGLTPLQWFNQLIVQLNKAV